MKMIRTLAILFTIFVGAASAQQMAGQFDISAAEVRTMLAKDKNAVLIDVRSPREYSEERIADTPLIPLQFLEQRMSELEKYKKKKIIVYCYSGGRSDLAVEILRDYGFNAVNMRGGLIQWKSQRYPTIKGGSK
jgi:rhodanese-related sulfurtransferase